MKKLFIVLAVASIGFVSCNNESASEEVKVDSAAIADSVAKAEAAAAAAAAPIDSVAKAAADSAAKLAADSAAKH
jgi:hypothetical protein